MSISSTNMLDYQRYLTCILNNAQYALESFKKINDTKQVEFYRGKIAGIKQAIEAIPFDLRR